MGSVLSFSPRAATELKATASDGLASIIIFPGVRYERLFAAEASAEVVKGMHADTCKDSRREDRVI